MVSFHDFEDRRRILEKRIGYSFASPEILRTALTHSTYAYEHRADRIQSNERLEFVGDGILDFTVAEVLYRRASEKDEGYLSKTRALIVCETTLAEIAEEIGLGECLYLGHGETLTGGKDKASNLSNAMEALLAACFFDGGFENARKLILFLLSSPIEKALRGELIFDYKSRVLEWAQTKGNSRKVRFDILREDGPVHERIYTAGVFLDDELLVEGTGLSKKQAEQDAAKSAYEFMKSGFSN